MSDKKIAIKRQVKKLESFLQNGEKTRSECCKLLNVKPYNLNSLLMTATFKIKGLYETENGKLGILGV